MRILHILDHSLPLQSGYVYRTLGILSAQRSFGWTTIQLTSPRYNRSLAPTETVDGWEFVRSTVKSNFAEVPVLRDLLEIRATERRIDEIIAIEQPDIIHAHSPVLNGIPALRAAQRAGLPIVYEVRAFWEDAAVDLGRARAGGFRYHAIRQLETYVLRHADAVVSLCNSMRDEIIARGIPEDRVGIVPNAVDLAFFDKQCGRDEILAEELDLTGRTVLGFFGSFYHYEGLDLLIAALPLIRATRPEAVLLLAGGGPEEERLKAKAEQTGQSDAVRFVGRVPHGEIQRYYSLVDFFVYPRRKMRLTDLVTPLKPLEAMAAERIVTASDVGGHRELIRDGETGFLFPSGDTRRMANRLIEIISTTDKHARIRNVAREYVDKNRTWSICATAYQDVYKRILRAGR
jgi:PEP-CTERM/exosortase A-associated glycosyltransferase